MTLTDYKRKRNFRRTPEPQAERAKSAGCHQFVVQKHAASRLHYDFRLEHDGTLKSWAVPKGPSLDPTVKALAVQVEDHPLAYANFEGTIPPGEYGGGTVMVWDQGTWEPDGDADKALKQGNLKFQLHGEKLQGGWVLVRMSGQAGDNGKNWLLIKHRDDAARPQAKFDVLKKKPLSVLSGREMEEIAAAVDRVWSGNGKSSQTKKSGSRKSIAAKKVIPKNPVAMRRGMGGSGVRATDVAKLTGARRAKQPATWKPQLATLATEVPSGEQWLHELKFDGYRMLAFVAYGKVRLVTRNGNDWTDRFPSIAKAMRYFPINRAILDGEIVSLNQEGRSDFQQLQNLIKHRADQSLVYYLFDAPHLQGYDLTQAPLFERKKVLSQLVAKLGQKNGGALRYSDHIQGHGESVLQQACQGGMEGIVCKRADSTYQQLRSPDWRKLKCTRRQEFVIGGYTKPSGSRVGFGALLLGYYKDGELIYSGRVGTGFNDQSLRELSAALRKRKATLPPFNNPPTGSEVRGVTWVKPDLVGVVEFTEWTDDGLLRHPSFQGLREDKPAKQIVREIPQQLSTKGQSAKESLSRSRTKRIVSKTNADSNDEAIVAGIRITHPNREVFPEAKITKLDLAKFYDEIAEWVLPHVIDRPLTLVRCPSGRTGQCFYQKHLTDALPDSVRGVMIQEKSEREEYVVIDDLPGLVSLVQLSVLEFHPWPARADQVERPDQLVFDLDPGEGVEWKAVVIGAKHVHDLLAELGLQSFLRTSGGKGLHIVVPLQRRNSWEELKNFAKSLAGTMVRDAPDRYIATMSKAKRRGKLFVDYLRNQRGATAIASYSTRARAGAPIATPLAWGELSVRMKPDKYTVKNLWKRLTTLPSDPWADFFTIRQTITRAMRKALQ